MAKDKSMIGISPMSMDQHMPHKAYVADDSDKILAIWQKRIATYFPDVVKHILEYRMRYISKGSKIFPRGCVLLMDDGSLKEFIFHKETGSAELRTTYEHHTDME